MSYERIFKNIRGSGPDLGQHRVIMSPFGSVQNAQSPIMSSLNGRQIDQGVSRLPAGIFQHYYVAASASDAHPTLGYGLQSYLPPIKTMLNPAIA